MSADFDVVFDATAVFPPGDPLAPIHAFIVRTRDAYGRIPAPAPRADLALLFRDKPERAVITLAPRPSTSTARARRRRARRVLLVAAALAVAVVTTGGLAVAGVLPAWMQETISDVLDRVGIDVPRGPDSTPPPARPATAVDATPGSPAGANAGTAPPTPASTPMSTAPVAAADPSASGAPTTTIPGLPLPPVAPVVPLPPAIDLPLLPLPPLPVVPIDPPIDVPLPPLDLPIIPPIDVPLPLVEVHGPAVPGLPLAAIVHRNVKP